jgi:hypothetical protein
LVRAKKILTEIKHQYFVEVVEWQVPGRRAGSKNPFWKLEFDWQLAPRQDYRVVGHSLRSGRGSQAPVVHAEGDVIAGLNAPLPA